MRKTKQKFAVMNMHCIFELKRAWSLEELLEKMPRRLKNWQVIEYRDDSGSRVAISRAIRMHVEEFENLTQI